MLAVGLLGCEMADLPAGLLCLLEIRDSIELEVQVFLRWEGKFAALGSFGGRKAEEPSLMFMGAGQEDLDSSMWTLEPLGLLFDFWTRLYTCAYPPAWVDDYLLSSSDEESPAVPFHVTHVCRGWKRSFLAWIMVLCREKWLLLVGKLLKIQNFLKSLSRRAGPEVFCGVVLIPGKWIRTRRGKRSGEKPCLHDWLHLRNEAGPVGLGNHWKLSLTPHSTTPQSYPTLASFSCSRKVWHTLGGECSWLFEGGTSKCGRAATFKLTLPNGSRR